MNVKSLDEELAGRYGVDVEYAKGVIARDTDRINVVKSQLESELVKLLPPRSEFA